MSEKINETGTKTPNGNGVSTTEKKGWFASMKEKHEAKKEKFAKEHPVAKKRIDTGLKVGGGFLLGVAAKFGLDALSDAFSGSSNPTEYEVIPGGSFEEVTDNTNNDTQEVTTED